MDIGTGRVEGAVYEEQLEDQVDGSCYMEISNKMEGYQQHMSKEVIMKIFGDEYHNGSPMQDKSSLSSSVVTDTPI